MAEANMSYDEMEFEQLMDSFDRGRTPENAITGSEVGAQPPADDQDEIQFKQRISSGSSSSPDGAVEMVSPVSDLDKVTRRVRYALQQADLQDFVAHFVRGRHILDTDHVEILAHFLREARPDTQLLSINTDYIKSGILYLEHHDYDLDLALLHYMKIDRMIRRDDLPRPKGIPFHPLEKRLLEMAYLVGKFDSESFAEVYEQHLDGKYLPGESSRCGELDRDECERWFVEEFDVEVASEDTVVDLITQEKNEENRAKIMQKVMDERSSLALE